MHLDEEQVQRLRHGELGPRIEASVREHLAGCTDCRRRIAEAEREEDELNALLRQVDHAPPRIDVHAIGARARTHDAGRLRWAAGVLLLLGFAGAAYAAPGSPLPGWLKTAAARMGTHSTRAPIAPAPPQASHPSGAGVAVAPGPALVILFTSHQSAGAARVSLTDGPEVVVHAPIGAASFTSDVDRLVIDNHTSSANFEIEIPRGAPQVEIRVGGDRIFLKQGPRVTGPYLLSLRGPEP